MDEERKLLKCPRRASRSLGASSPVTEWIAVIPKELTRCTARGAVRGRLQRPLDPADDFQENPVLFVVPVVDSGGADYLTKISSSHRPSILATLKAGPGYGLK